MADLADGETTTMQGSGAKPYELKNVGGVYSCSCPAWRNQSLAIEKRTCKHLKKLRGEEAEAARVGGAVPPPRARSEKAEAAKAKAKAAPVLLAETWDGALGQAWRVNRRPIGSHVPRPLGQSVYERYRRAAPGLQPRRRSGV